MPELQGTQFTLRPYRADDAEALARAADHRNVWRTLGHAFPHPYTLTRRGRGSRVVRRGLIPTSG